MNDEELKAAIAFFEERGLKPGEDFGTRKQATAIVALCFRNTQLENFDARGYLGDDETEDLSIEACARTEYLMLSGKFDHMAPADIFTFAFMTVYRRGGNGRFH
jgi:hypothetical protein